MEYHKYGYAPSSRLAKAFARSLRLQSLLQALPLNSSQEPQKVAVYKSRQMAFIQSIIHIVPLSVAIYLIVSNAIALIVPDYSASMGTGLQFAAKSLEILMQTSIATIFLGLLRRRLVSADTVPLGVLFAPPQTTNISFLWSLEFWGLLTADWLQKRKRLVLGIITCASITLAALVGPSSAVLMIPRLSTRPARKLHVFFDNDTTLYPDRLDLADLKTSN